MDIIEVAIIETPWLCWAEDDRGLEWDSDGECYRTSSGVEVTRGAAIACGAIVEYWRVSDVLLDRTEASHWLRVKSYNYPDGGRVRVIPMVPSTHPRTHEVLARDFTRDPIFLLQTKVTIIGAADGEIRWRTDAAALTREDGNVWRGDNAGRRVYGHHTEWELCNVLGALTEGGRYT